MKAHNENIATASLYDVVAAVDKVQKHTDSRVLTEPDLRLALRALEYFTTFGETQVTVWGGHALPFFKYTVPCTLLTLTVRGGNVRRADAPVIAPGQTFHRMRVRVMRTGGRVPIPRAVMGLRRTADADELVEYLST